MSQPTRVLVTNDDGIDAEGIRVLTAALVEHGLEPVVVAPNRDYSGAAGSLLSIGADEPLAQETLRYEKKVLAEAPDVEAYSLDGPPALCALVAMREAFGPRPQLVASGINLGLNVGPSVMHSGTVNAAITGARFGVPALAISAAFRPGEDSELRYDTAAALAVKILDAQIAGDHSVVSLNVPCCDLSEVKGVVSAELATSFHWRTFIESTHNGVITRKYRESGEPPETDSDAAWVEQGYATVSSLVPITTIDCDDLVRSVAGPVE